MKNGCLQSWMSKLKWYYGIDVRFACPTLPCILFSTSSYILSYNWLPASQLGHQYWPRGITLSRIFARIHDVLVRTSIALSSTHAVYIYYRSCDDTIGWYSWIISKIRENSIDFKIQAGRHLHVNGVRTGHRPVDRLRYDATEVWHYI